MSPDDEPAASRPSAYDHALKRLLEAAHDSFLALIAPQVTFDAALATELPATTRTADLVWRVSFDAPDGARQQGLLHIELQTRIERDITDRLIEYFTRLWVRERRAQRAQGAADPQVQLRTIVVFLRPSPQAPPTSLVIPFGAAPQLHFTFEIIRLWELPPERVLATSDYRLWPLSSVMANVTPETTLATAQRLAEAPIPRQERSDLIGLLLTLASIRLRGIRLRTLVEGNTMLRDLLDDPNVLEFFRDDAMDKAIAEASARAAAQGATQGRIEIARLLLEDRFGPLPADLLAALTALDAAALAETVRHAASETLSQLRARLGLPA